MADSMRMLGEGAESRVFETRLFGKKIVVKVRHAKRYRIKEIDENLRKSRTRKEARSMHRAGEAGVRVPILFGVGQFSIFMERVSGRLLKDVDAEEETYAGIGRMLARMHNANVVHGDFTPANIIVNKGAPKIIDFGLADISDSIEDKAIDLLLMKRSISKKNYSRLQTTYVKEYTVSSKVLSRLAEIEKRGRYQIRTLA